MLSNNQIETGPRPLPRRASTLRVMITLSDGLIRAFRGQHFGDSRYAGSSIQVNDALGAVDLDQGAAPQ
jgi:hypothetical protein